MKKGSGHGRGGKCGGDLASVGAEAYDQAAEFGRFMALVGLCIGGFVGFVLFCIGIYILVKKPSMTETVKTTDANGKPVTTTKPGSSKTTGYVFIAFGIIIPILAYVHYYIVTRFKMAAAATGVGDAVGVGDAAFDSFSS